MKCLASLPLVLGTLCLAGLAPAQSAWMGFGGDASHSGQSKTPSLALNKVVWSQAVDFAPPYSGDSLLIHYGSPCITPSNKVIVPIRTSASDTFRVSTFNGGDGRLLWSVDSSYRPPAADWKMSFNPTLVPSNNSDDDFHVAWPESGGRISLRSSTGVKATRSTIAFYGNANYELGKSSFDQFVRISTPLTVGVDGSIYFGYEVSGQTSPVTLQNGFARVRPDGSATYVNADDLAGYSSAILKKQGAPALSRDGRRAYVVVSGSGTAQLVAIDTSSLQPVSRTSLYDPAFGITALIDSAGTASPLVGPDGDVYVGVGENPFGSHNYHGWLLHFSKDLKTPKIPGAFGWDNTPSIVPSSIVGLYPPASAAAPSTNDSPYLLFSKYNNYAGIGGDGKNRIAMLDPNHADLDPISGIPVMKVVMSQVGQTHDPRFSDPEACMEWCISAGVVDVKGKCVLANSEDGLIYRWNLQTNKLSERIRITPGLGQAYTVTLIGPDGKVYAINNATLFAVGTRPRREPL